MAALLASPDLRGSLAPLLRLLRALVVHVLLLCSVKFLVVQRLVEVSFLRLLCALLVVHVLLLRLVVGVPGSMLQVLQARILLHLALLLVAESYFLVVEPVPPELLLETLAAQPKSAASLELHVQLVKLAHLVTSANHLALAALALDLSKTRLLKLALHLVAAVPSVS